MAGHAEGMLTGMIKKKGLVKVLNPPRKKIDLQKQDRKIVRIAKTVRTLRKGTEVKRADSELLGQSVSTTGVFTLLNGVAQGDDVINRDGNRIYMLNMEMSFEILIADTFNKVRFIVFYDKQPNGAAPSASDILQDPGNYPITSRYNYDNRQRFKFLYDRVFIVDVDQPTITVGKKWLKLKKDTLYSGSGNTITAIKTGSIYLFLISDSNASTHPTVTWNARIRFMD